MTTRRRPGRLPGLILPTAVAGALAAGALAGCGSSAAHPSGHGALKATGHRTVAGLPPRARVVYASDTPVSGTAPASAVAGNAKIIAVNGFLPGRDGFSFQNYSFVAGTEVSVHGMRELFGDGVCATAPSDTCTLTPAAQGWAQQASAYMAGGHCFGFSMTALRFFDHNLSPSTYGASTTYGLGFSPALQSEIATDWAAQTIPDVEQEETAYTPVDMVSHLVDAMHRGVLETLLMWSPTTQEGHAITPVGVAHIDATHAAILVYDNNYPGVVRAVMVDTAADTWSYQVQVNPSAPDAVWSGQGTNNPLRVVPVTAVEHVHPCPFCAAAGTAAARRASATVTLAGNPDAHAHVLITTPDGRHIGYLNGRFVDQIPGARIIKPTLSEIWAANPEPIYQVPAGDRVTITLTGGNPTGHDPAAVQVSGPSFAATVGHLVPSRSSHPQVVVSPGGTTVSVAAAGAAQTAAPSVQVARNAGRAGSTVEISTASLPAHDRLTVALSPAAGRATVSSSQPTAKVGVTVLTVNRRGVHTVSTATTITRGRSKTVRAGTA